MKTLEQIILEIKELDLPEQLSSVLITILSTRFDLMTHQTIQSIAITMRIYCNQFKDQLDENKLYKLTNLILDFSNLK